MNEAGGRIEIGRIGIAGATAAMGDGVAFGRLLETALIRALGGMEFGETRSVTVDALKIRVRQGAEVDEIATAVAAGIADAAKEG